MGREILRDESSREWTDDRWHKKAKHGDFLPGGTNGGIKRGKTKVRGFSGEISGMGGTIAGPIRFREDTEV